MVISVVLCCNAFASQPLTQPIERGESVPAAGKSYAPAVSSSDTAAYDVKYVIVDYQEVLTEEELSELLQEAQNVCKSYGINVGVVLSNGLDGKSSERYTKDFLYEQFGKNSDSIVLMLVKSGTGQQDWIYCEGKAYDIFYPWIDSIFDKVYEGLDDGGENYFKAIRNFFKSIQNFCRYVGADKTVENAANERYNSSDGDSERGMEVSFIVIVLFAACVIVAVAVVNGIAKGYSKRAPLSAQRYLDRSRTHFIKREDIFVREYTTSHKISSSSSGGGHRSSGGGGHRSGGGGGRRR